MIKQTGLLLLLLVLAGCVGTTASRFEPRAPAEEEAIVYVYRPARTGNFMLSPGLLINERRYFKIENGKHRVLRMKAGRYVFEIEPYSDLYSTPPPLKLQIRNGETRYLRVDTRLEFVPEGMNRRLFELVEVNPGDALEQLQATSPP